MRRIVLLLSVATSACESPYKTEDASGDSGQISASEDDVPTTDGGASGAGSSDGGTADGGSADGGSADGGSADGGSADGGSADGGSADGGSADGGSADGGETGDTSSPVDPEYAVRTELPEDYLSLLTETVACDDTWMAVYSDDHTIGLRAYMPSVLSEADGAAYNQVRNLPHASAQVTLEVGGNIPRNWCTDSLSDDVVVNGSWVANFGTLTMYINALDDSESAPTGRFTLSGVDFAFEGGWVDTYESPVMDILTAWGG